MIVRVSMKQAAEIRNDIVLKSIKNVTSEEMDNNNADFVYHNIRDDPLDIGGDREKNLKKNCCLGNLLQKNKLLPILLEKNSLLINFVKKNCFTFVSILRTFCRIFNFLCAARSINTFFAT